MTCKPMKHCRQLPLQVEVCIEGKVIAVSTYIAAHKPRDALLVCGPSKQPDQHAGLLRHDVTDAVGQWMTHRTGHVCK